MTGTLAPNFVNCLGRLTLVLVALMLACNPDSTFAQQADRSDAVAPRKTDPLFQLRAIATGLDNPLSRVRYSAVQVKVRKSDAPDPSLVGTISATKTILYTDEDPKGRYKADDIAYIEEFTIFADYVAGKWVYAGCKGRYRKPTETEWQAYEGTRKEIRLHCMDELDAMRMNQDADAE